MSDDAGSDSPDSTSGSLGKKEEEGKPYFHDHGHGHSSMENDKVYDYFRE